MVAISYVVPRVVVKKRSIGTSPLLFHIVEKAPAHVSRLRNAQDQGILYGLPPSQRQLPLDAADDGPMSLALGQWVLETEKHIAGRDRRAFDSPHHFRARQG